MRVLTSGRNTLVERRTPSRIGAKTFTLLRIGGGRVAAESIALQQKIKYLDCARTIYPSKVSLRARWSGSGECAPRRGALSPLQTRADALTITCTRPTSLLLRDPRRTANRRRLDSAPSP